MGIQFCFSSKPIMKSLLLVALAFAAVVWLSLRPMLPLMPGMDIMDIPAITDTAVMDTTVWDTADTTVDTGRGKPRLRPNPLPPLRPTPLPMPTTDTTDTAVLMDTTVD